MLIMIIGELPLSYPFSLFTYLLPRLSPRLGPHVVLCHVTVSRHENQMSWWPRQRNAAVAESLVSLSGEKLNTLYRQNRDLQIKCGTYPKFFKALCHALFASFCPSSPCCLSESCIKQCSEIKHAMSSNKFNTLSLLNFCKSSNYRSAAVFSSNSRPPSSRLQKVPIYMQHDSTSHVTPVAFSVPLPMPSFIEQRERRFLVPKRYRTSPKVAERTTCSWYFGRKNRSWQNASARNLYINKNIQKDKSKDTLGHTF